jgi:hypothetical protein
MHENEWFNTIYNNLNLLETDDLISHWQKRDEEEWTPVAFDVMEKILIKRLGKLPAKVEYDEPKMEMDIETSGEKPKLISELKTLIRDNDPVFYDPEKITLFVKWIFRSVNFLIILSAVKFIIDNVPVFRTIFEPNYFGSGVLLSLLLSLVGLILTSMLLFFSYKALGYVLKILREMEINSRSD